MSRSVVSVRQRNVEGVSRTPLCLSRERKDGRVGAGTREPEVSVVVLRPDSQSLEVIPYTKVTVNNKRTITKPRSRF